MTTSTLIEAQAYEALLLRMRAHPLEEVRDYGDLIHAELIKIIPAFLRRLDQPERGGRWTHYFATIQERMKGLAETITAPVPEMPAVKLLEWDPDAETKLAASALYPYSQLPEEALLDIARTMTAEERRTILETCFGERENRRHKPGRALERVFYRFEVLSNYAVFRDLQRHRLLTVEWQALSTAHGFDLPEAVAETGARETWEAAMAKAAGFYEELKAAAGADVAQYVVPFAYRVRFYWHLNAREAFHILELRTQRGGDPAYRLICQEMHRLIREQAGHRIIADGMKFVDYEDYGLGRLESERRIAARRAAAGLPESDVSAARG